MDRNEFMKWLSYLKKFYVNSKLDITDPVTLAIWYDNLKDLTNEQMQELIMEYVAKNDYAPLSPRDIKKLIPVVDDVETAWNKIMDVYKRSFDNSYMMRELYKEHPTLYPFVSKYDFFNVPKDSFGNSCIGYCIGKPFKRDYKAYIDSLKIKHIEIGTESNLEKHLLIGG